MEGRVKITVTIKLRPSCNAEHKEKQVNKETSDTIVIYAPTPTMPYSKKIWNTTLPTTSHDKRAACQSGVAGGTVLGEAVHIAVGIFPYHGGPKGFETENVDIVYVNETFTSDHCCGIIVRANGFGMYDRFCTKKDVLSKLISNQNSSQRPLFSLPLAQMILHSVVISYVA
jgi:hypothetical protein